MATIEVSYKIPREREEEIREIFRDGDWNGVLEYAQGYEVIGMEAWP